MKKTLILFFVFLFSATAALAQAGGIKGRVVDKETNEPLIGVTIALESSRSTGTMTDVDGYFAIKANAGDKLRVSYIGYDELVVEAANGMEIALQPKTSTLDEVVVVGYGTMKKSDLTGSLSSVKGADLTVLSSPNVASALGGRAAGLQVVSSGAVDGAVKVRVRGVGTVNNSDPLYVVDGFPSGDISYIAPTDIESIEVLKDASATAIYGSRGANGVIMVTTKKGTKQKTTATYNGFFGARKVSKYLDLLDAKDYARAIFEANAATGEKLTTEGEARLNYAINNNSKGTDWQRELTRTGSVQSHNLSVMGGSDAMRYNLSGTYSMEEGTLKNSFVDKLFLKFNTDYQFSKMITFGADISFIDYEMSASELGNLYGASQSLGVRASPASPVFDQYDNWEDVGGLNPARVNEFEKYRRRHGNKLVGNFYLNFDLGKGLSFKSTFGADYNFGKYKSYGPKYYVSQTERSEESSLYEDRSDGFGWANSNVLNYKFDLEKIHRFDVMLGQEWSHSEWTSINATAYDVAENEDMRYFSAAKGTLSPTPGSGQGTARLLSHFARLNYSFDNKYLLTATIRRDGTSRFAEDFRFGYFPSVSLGWNVAQEPFMKNFEKIDQFKLRAGWGEVGNQSSTGLYDYLPLISNNIKYVWGDEVYEGRLPTRLPSIGLQWEVAQQINVGADLAFFNSKLMLNLDYYVKDTKRMIVVPPVPTFMGAGSPMGNVGTLKNKGFEITLNHENRIGDFTYNAGFNLSFLSNKVTSLGDAEVGSLDRNSYDRLGVTSRTEVGHEIAYYWGYETDGIFNNQSELNAHTHKGNAIQPNAQLGDVKYIDRNNDGKIDDEDKTYLGSYIPDFTGGLNLSGEYKNFFVSIFADFVCGNKIANLNVYELRSGKYGTNILRDYYNNRWTPENPNNNEQRLTADPGDNIRFSDRFVEDGSYLRIRNVQFGYNLPASLLQKVYLKGCKLYVSVDNLATFTKYTGFNPEIADQYGDPLKAGSDTGSAPLPRTVAFGINLKF